MTNDNQPREMNEIITAKIEAAYARGVDLSPFTLNRTADHSALLAEIGLTAAEQEWMAKEQISLMAKIEIGRRIVEVLEQHFKVHRPDIIPSLEAYFETQAA